MVCWGGRQEEWDGNTPPSKSDEAGAGEEETTNNIKFV
jgi:hypothetical protein